MIPSYDQLLFCSHFGSRQLCILRPVSVAIDKLCTATMAPKKRNEKQAEGQSKRRQLNRRDCAAKVERAMREKVYGVFPKWKIDTVKVDGKLIEETILYEYEICAKDKLAPATWERILKDFGAEASPLDAVNVPLSTDLPSQPSEDFVAAIDEATTKSNKGRDLEPRLILLQHKMDIQPKQILGTMMLVNKSKWIGKIINKQSR